MTKSNHGTISISRVVWSGSDEESCTAGSHRSRPRRLARTWALPEDVLELLGKWRSRTGYPNPEDWVFASPRTKGKRPLWPDHLMKKRIQPIAVAAGIPKIGWHSFRHTVSAWGKEAGFSLEEIKTLLRHENIATTSQIYGAIEMEAKRALLERLVEYVKRKAKEEGWTPTAEVSWTKAMASERVQ